MKRTVKRLIKWWKAEPVKREHGTNRLDPIVADPVTIDTVDAAPVPNKDIERETQEALGKLAGAVVNLGRKSYELRRTLGQDALLHVNGGNPR